MTFNVLEKQHIQSFTHTIQIKINCELQKASNKLASEHIREKLFLSVSCSFLSIIQIIRNNNRFSIHRNCFNSEYSVSKTTTNCIALKEKHKILVS